jgi:hypothetical protein
MEILSAVAVIVCLMLGSIIWACFDAERRGKDWRLVGLLAMVGWPVGLLIWIVCRPPRSVLH